MNSEARLDRIKCCKPGKIESLPYYRIQIPDTLHATSAARQRQTAVMMTRWVLLDFPRTGCQLSVRKETCYSIELSQNYDLGRMSLRLAALCRVVLCSQLRCSHCIPVWEVNHDSHVS